MQLVGSPGGPPYTNGLDDLLLHSNESSVSLRTALLPKGPSKQPAKSYEPTGALTQLLVTMKRQFIQKFRMPMSMLLEMLLPIVFVLGLVAGNSAAGTDTKPGANFVVPVTGNLPFAPGTSPLAQNPSPAVKARFCYNGSAMTAAEAATAVYGGNCADGRLRCSVGVGPAQCEPLFSLVCTDAYARFKTIPPGFCFYDDALLTLPGLTMNNGPMLPFDMSAMILMQWAALIANNGPNTEPLNSIPLLCSGPLLFAPSSPATSTLIGLLNSSEPMFRFVAGRTFDSASDARAFLTSTDGEGHWGLVEVNELSLTGGAAVTLSLNRTAVPITSSVLARFSGGLASTGFRSYVNSGFATLMTTIDRLYLRSVVLPSAVGAGAADLVNVTSLLDAPSVVVAPMGYAPYKSSTFLTIAGQVLAPLVLVLSFLYSVSQLAKRLVEEKELRLREGTMVMGLGKIAFYASWILTYVVQMLVSSILITIVIKKGLIKQSDPVLIFVWVFLFAVSTVLLATLISSFFSKSRITALVVPLIYFGLSIPSFALPDTTGRGTYVILSLFSPTAFGIGSRLLFSYEINNGMGWGDLANADDTVNMGGVLGLLIFDCILYFVLSMYLDSVLPSEWGTRAHPCFCCMCCCSGGGAGDSDDAGAFSELKSGNRPIPAPGRSADVLEEYPHGGSGSTVHLCGLRKEFASDSGVKVAVNDMDLKIFPDQITVLLGHNGAGKTTTMNMITGMLSITRGDCMVYGKSARHDLRGVRSEIGYCPQHNILWGNLTCAEHLRYFARLKGVPSSEVEAEVDTMLEKVDLLDKKDVFSDMLSGGQKRKLSVGIAFIGGSRLILLDEPTAGMDVAARRHTWDLLMEMSAGRTIILTTHFMDEADLLGSRIAIMSGGALHSYGSPMFLKANLGTGYALRLSLGSASGAAPTAAAVEETSVAVLKHIRGLVPDAALKEVKGQEVAYSLPMRSAGSFAQLIRSLEDAAMAARHSILGLSMSVATLEDVFVRIAEEEELQGEQDVGAHAAHATTATMLEDVYKRLEARPCEISVGRQFGGLLLKRFNNARRDRRTLVLQVVLPVACILLAMILAQLGPPDSPLLPLDISMYKTTQEVPVAGLDAVALAPLLAASASSVVMSTDGGVNQSYDFSVRLLNEFKSHGGKDRMIAFSLGDTSYAADFTALSNASGNLYSSASVALFNATSVHSLPEAIAAFHDALSQRVGGGHVKVASFPLPFTARQKATINGMTNLIIGIFILIPFTFIPSTYVSFVVKERECRAKHLQMVSGVNFFAYWSANYVFDLASFIVTEALALIIFAIFNRTEYIGSDAIGGTLVLFTLYGLSGVASAYAFSFLFTNHGTAQNITMLSNFMAGFALVITVYILQAIPSTESAANVIVFICRIIPTYCLGEGILNLAQLALSAQFGGKTNVWDMDTLGWDLVFMSVEVLLFAAVTLLWDHPKRQLREQQLLFDRNAQAPDVAKEDVDVRQERTEVEGDAPQRRTDVVTVKKLRKVYANGKVAVENISFGVKQGEVFGFLGTNGAGKTTTMSILTSEFLPSMGHCAVGGFDVVEHAAESQRLMGFCPQFDALLDLLTCEEHLNLYAALRGVSLSDTAPIVETLLTVCGIAQYRSVPSKKLSGGNKRKLSVALALLGAPKLVLLDEPSAGMDPQARRMMWDVISFVARKSSVVLTTHHLEEVDVLAHRVGIMVDGTLRCLGSLDHLKRKFGSGYEICVKTVSPTVENGSVGGSRTRRLLTGAAPEPDITEADAERMCDEVVAFMKREFPSITLLERRQRRLTFSISSRATALSKLFDTLHRAKEARSVGVTEYTVQQSSLEQVFLRISEGGVEEHDSAPLTPLAMLEQRPRTESFNFSAYSEYL